MSKRLKALSVSNLYAKKFKTLPLGDGAFFNVFNEDLPLGGVWLIHGDEKQGKTTLCLSLAKYLSKTNKVLYIQIEQSSDKKDIDKIFVDSMARVGIDSKDNISFFGDLDKDDVVEVLSRKESAGVVFFDNVSFSTWINTAVVRELSKKFKNKTFVYVSHNDRNGDPSGSTGKAIKRLANTIFSVDAIRAEVVGRGGWGGNMNIDWKKGIVMYGND